MMDQEIYHSSTLGPIPLSFTGRRLMQNLREAVEEMTTRASNAARAGRGCPVDNWEPVSQARGRLAKYISELERKRNIDSFTDTELICEMQRRLAER